MAKVSTIKNSIAFMILLSAFACGSGDETTESIIAEGDLEQIRSKKKELSSQLKSLEAEITKLDKAIDDRTDDRNLPLVTTFQTNAENFNHYVELQGDVTTDQNVLIYPEVAGMLIKVYVKEGDKVRKGQLLANIDDGGLRSQLLQMKTQLELAKTTYERRERLWDQKIGSEIQFLESKASYEGQLNAIAQMESQLAKYSVKAPFSGIIDDVIQDEGTVVAPGGPGSEVFRIVNLSNMHLEVSVPESYITSVTPGKHVKIYFPVLNETVESKVRQTGNFINPDNRSFTVEIPVPNKSGLVKPNLTAKVQINEYQNESAILIPQSVLSENSEGEQYVFLVSDIQADNHAKANKRIVTTGKTQGDYVEILTGLSSGENIIVEGARSVKDGQQVKILERQS
ncbi:MAG: efflux RND transporter periplasmic adaptor subunit [Bacteroidota bacterium]